MREHENDKLICSSESDESDSGDEVSGSDSSYSQDEESTSADIDASELEIAMKILEDMEGHEKERCILGTASGQCGSYEINQADLENFAGKEDESRDNANKSDTSCDAPNREPSLFLTGQSIACNETNLTITVNGAREGLVTEGSQLTEEMATGQIVSNGVSNPCGSECPQTAGRLKQKTGEQETEAEEVDFHESSLATEINISENAMVDTVAQDNDQQPKEQIGEKENEQGRLDAEIYEHTAAEHHTKRSEEIMVAGTSEQKAVVTEIGLVLAPLLVADEPLRDTHHSTAEPASNQCCQVNPTEESAPANFSQKNVEQTGIVSESISEVELRNKSTVSSYLSSEIGVGKSHISFLLSSSYDPVDAVQSPGDIQDRLSAESDLKNATTISRQCSEEVENIKINNVGSAPQCEIKVVEAFTNCAERSNGGVECSLAKPENDERLEDELPVKASEVADNKPKVHPEETRNGMICGELSPIELLQEPKRTAEEAEILAADADETTNGVICGDYSPIGHPLEMALLQDPKGRAEAEVLAVDTEATKNGMIHGENSPNDPPQELVLLKDPIHTDQEAKNLATLSCDILETSSALPSGAKDQEKTIQEDFAEKEALAIKPDYTPNDPAGNGNEDDDASSEITEITSNVRKKTGFDRRHSSVSGAVPGEDTIPEDDVQSTQITDQSESGNLEADDSSSGNPWYCPFMPTGEELLVSKLESIAPENDSKGEFECVSSQTKVDDNEGLANERELGTMREDVDSSSEAQGESPTILAPTRETALEDVSPFVDTNQFIIKKKVHFRDPFQKPAPTPVAKEVIADTSKQHDFAQIHWKKPSQQVEDLIYAAQGENLSRRSNACGTLKVMATKENNKHNLARTKGVVGALTFAAKQNSREDTEHSTHARIRAVIAIVHLSSLSGNRLLLVQYPDFTNSLVNVIEGDDDEARTLACTAFAFLAKSKEARFHLAKEPNLLNAFAKIIKGEESWKVTPSNTPVSSVHSDDDDKYWTEDDVGMKNTVHTRTSRSNVCAVLLHLSNESSSSEMLCHHVSLPRILARVSGNFKDVIHTRCLEVLCNFTRFSPNNGHLASQTFLVEALIGCTKSLLEQDRIWAVRALQNLTSDKNSKVFLATASLLTCLSLSALSSDKEEQIAALSAILNLSGDPGTITTVTNTKNVVATIVNLAHFQNSSAEVRLLACDCLAAIGLWLQSISSEAPVPEGTEDIIFPTNAVIGWRRWD